MLKDWKAALIAGLIGASVFATITHISGSGGRLYFDPVEYERVDTMPYKEAKEFLYKRSLKITRWESLRNAVQFREFWLGYLADIILYTLIGFLSCLIFGRLKVQFEELD